MTVQSRRPPIADLFLVVAGYAHLFWIGYGSGIRLPQT